MPNRYSHSNVLSHFDDIGVVSLQHVISAQHALRNGDEDDEENAPDQKEANIRIGRRRHLSLQEPPAGSMDEKRPRSLQRNTKTQPRMGFEILNSYNRASTMNAMRQSSMRPTDSRKGQRLYLSDSLDSLDRGSGETQRSSSEQKTPELSSASSSLNSSVTSPDSIAPPQIKRRSQPTATLPANTSATKGHAQDVPASERIGAKVDQLRIRVGEPQRKSIPRPARVKDADISKILRQTTLSRGPPDPSDVRRKDGIEVVEDIRLSSKNTNGAIIANEEAKEVNDLDEDDIKPDFVPQRQASPPPAVGYEDTKHIEARAAEKNAPEILPENVMVGEGHLPESGLVQSKEQSQGEVPMAKPRIVSPDDPVTNSQSTQRQSRTSLAGDMSKAVHRRHSDSQDAVPPDVSRFRASHSNDRNARKKEIRDAERRVQELKALQNDNEEKPGILKKIKSSKRRLFNCM